MYLLYKHTSPSGKSYIGITNDYNRRCYEHRTIPKDTPFSRAIRKYGWDAFTHEIISNTDILEEAQIAEQHTITELNTQSPYGYNLQPGGMCRIQHEETRAKIRATLTGRPRSDETKQKIAKTYVCIDPTGEEFIVRNLHRFCNERNMDSSGLGAVARGRLKQYRGWLCWFFTPIYV